MKVVSLDVFHVTLPFRFAFGHNLAKRSCSENLVVRASLEDGTTGFGEGIPRDYVTGETIDQAVTAIEQVYAPRLIGFDTSSLSSVLNGLEKLFDDLGLQEQPMGASWCAVEMAILDAVSKAHRLSLSDWLGPVKHRSIHYGAVVPFSSRKALIAILWFYKLYRFHTVKLKVGRDIEEDLSRVSLARQILGADTILRVDANCAWTAEQAIIAADCFRKLNVLSYEQPVSAHDLDGLRKVTASIPEQVVADESLCTLEDARRLIAAQACTAFNIRLSKVGGVIAARRMIEIARSGGIRCHLGAQVGESGILSAAARALASTEEPMENYEGSDNLFLLTQDLTRQNLTVGWAGLGKLLPGPGLGVTIDAGRLESLGLRVSAVGVGQVPDKCSPRCS